MLRKLSYKQKLQLLACTAVIAMIVCYRLGISKTLTAYHQYTAYKQSSMEDLQSGNRQQSLESKAKNLDDVMSGFVLDTLNNEKNLLSVASTWCRSNNLMLKEFKPFALSNIDSMSVITQSLTIEGSFIDCTRLLYALETKFKAGKIASVWYRTITNVKTKEPELNCTLYVQNLNTYEHKKN